MSEPTFDKIGLETLAVLSKADKFNKWMYETIRPFLKGDILEIGSGIGNISKFVISDGYSVTLSDYNEIYCTNLKADYLTTPNVKDVFQIDLQHPNFRSTYHFLEEVFDTIFLLNVIEHLEDDSIAIQNCRFLLKEKGRVIALAPSYNWLYCEFDSELGHYRRYNQTSLARVFENNDFLVEKRLYFNFLGIAGWLLFGKILRRKMIQKNEMATFNWLTDIAKLLDIVVLKRFGLSTIVSGIKK